MVALPLDGTLTAMEEMQGIRSVEGGQTALNQACSLRLDEDPEPQPSCLTCNPSRSNNRILTGRSFGCGCATSIRGFGSASLHPFGLLILVSTGATCHGIAQLAKLSIHRSCKFMLPCTNSGPSAL